MITNELIILVGILGVISLFIFLGVLLFLLRRIHQPLTTRSLIDSIQPSKKTSMARMPLEPSKAFEVKRKLLEAGFNSTEILRTLADLIVWLAGVGMAVPLSAIGHRLELVRSKCDTIQEPVNIDAAVKGLVEVGWGVTCKICSFARESACPYFEPSEARFCCAVFEDFASGLASHGFNLSKEDSETLARELLEIDQPEIGGGRDFDVKYVRLLKNGYQPQARKVEDVHLEDLGHSGLKSSWTFAERVVKAASDELCFSSIGGWWALQEPFRSILTEKINKGLSIKAVLAVIPPYGNFRRRLIEYNDALAKIGCDITRTKYSSGRFLQVLIADRQAALSYYRDMESNNLYDPCYTTDTSTIEFLHQEFAKSFRKKSFKELFVSELHNTDISEFLDLTGIVVEVFITLMSAFLGLMIGGLVGALGSAILGTALGVTIVMLCKSVAKASRKRRQQR